MILTDGVPGFLTRHDKKMTTECMQLCSVHTEIL